MTCRPHRASSTLPGTTFSSGLVTSALARHRLTWIPFSEIANLPPPPSTAPPIAADTSSQIRTTRESRCRRNRPWEKAATNPTVRIRAPPAASPTAAAPYADRYSRGEGEGRNQWACPWKGRKASWRRTSSGPTRTSRTRRAAGRSWPSTRRSRSSSARIRGPSSRCRDLLLALALSYASLLSVFAPSCAFVTAMRIEVR